MSGGGATNGRDRPVTVKGAAGFLTVFFAFLGVMATVHAQVVLPTILSRTSEQTDAQIRRAMDYHSSGTHAGSVTRDNLELVLRLLEGMQAQLDAIDRRLESQGR